VTPSGGKFNKRITLTVDCIDEENQELLPNEDDIKWSQGEWQIKVLKPFIDSISSQSYENEQVQIIKHLRIIIDKTYESINEYGFRVIILSLKSLNFSRIPDDVFNQSYDILEMMSSEFLDFIGNQNIKLLMTCMKRYATYHQGIFEYKPNEKNTEICCKSSKIFLKIAKYLESYEEMDHEESIGDISTEPLWRALFTEIKLLFNEIQYNVIIRRSTLQAIHKIIDALPDSHDITLWEYIMDNILLGMFDRSVGKYIEQLVGFSTSKAREVKRKEISQHLQTPTFSFGGAVASEQPQSKKATKKGQGKRMKFDEESIKKFHQRSTDNSSSENIGFGMAPEETPKTHKPSQTSIDDQSI
jgi:hypothetical protein